MVVESGTPLDVNAHAHAHDISEYVPELAESSALVRSLGIHLPHL